eukprot:TRINITY_DN3670_c0_g1_i3.p1 TRINITY_DN3670_c0_g1~~TRINITY_DN3670_c0_g1_i3.p1  ORF type:complete len:424 (+),score=58.30 TRINITY_DN3670_c0_g1_i3:4-1275(+)
MAKKVGHLLVVEDDDVEDAKAGPLIVESDGSEEECIVFPSKAPSAKPHIDQKIESQKEKVKPDQKSNPKKRPAASAPTGSPSKKTKATTLVTEEPVAPHQNFNEDLTKILAELGETERNKGLLYKWRAYNQAVNSLKVHPKRIESGAEAKQLPGVGVKIAKKIQEILDTGQLKRLQADQADPLLAALNKVSKVTGIGPKMAQKLVYEEGIRTIEDLRAISHRLTHHQQLGLKYFDDFETRVPREEMDKWNEIIIASVKQVDPKLVGAICGSYRRGLPSSGDVDVLLTHPAYTMEEKEKGNTFKLMERLVKKLKADGFITDEMSCGAVKFMGVCRLPEPGAIARRLDLKLFPLESYAPGLLHFTGSGEYNRQLRGIAISKGFKLSEYGIYKVDESGEHQIPVQTEDDIFNILGVPYRSPDQRSL